MIFEGKVEKNRILAPAIINWIAVVLVMAVVSGFTPLALMGQALIITWFVLLKQWRWMGVFGGLSVVVDVWGTVFRGFVDASQGYPSPLVEWVIGSYFLTLVIQTAFLFYQGGLFSFESSSDSDIMRWRALFEQANDAIMILTLNHEIIDVNQRTLEMLGYARWEMIGRSRRDFVPKDEWEETVLRLGVILSGQNIPKYERRYIRKDGETIWVEASTSLVVNQEGLPLHIQTVMHDISERKELQEKLNSLLEEMEMQAKTDPLTGLWNRRAITEHAEGERNRAIRDNEAFSLLMVDLDNLKYINDTYGHLVGDEALNLLSKTLQWWRRSYDWVGRWGGDEFLVVLPQISGADAITVATRLLEKINLTSLEADGNTLDLQASIGVASCHNRRNELVEISLKELVDQADRALYQVKGIGGNRVVAFDSEE